DGDREAIESTFMVLAKDRVDFTIFWRRLSQFVATGCKDTGPVRDLFIDRDAFDEWLRKYMARSGGDDREAAGLKMLRTNPKYVLRNHLGELAIRDAKLKDFTAV